MEKQIWVRKSRTFEDAQNVDTEYYSSLSDTVRVEIVQELREAHFKSIGLQTDENGKRLRRVCRVVKQA